MRVKTFFKYHMGWLFFPVLLLVLTGMLRLTVLADTAGSIELQLPQEAAGAEITLYAVAEISDGSIHFQEREKYLFHSTSYLNN